MIKIPKLIIDNIYDQYDKMTVVDISDSLKSQIIKANTKKLLCELQKVNPSADLSIKSAEPFAIHHTIRQAVETKCSLEILYMILSLTGYNIILDSAFAECDLEDDNKKSPMLN